MVSLWDTLTMLSGASAFGGALAAIRIEGGGTARLVVGVLLGLGLAFAAMTAEWMAGRRASQLLPVQEDSPRAGALLALVYGAKFAWCLGLAPLVGLLATLGALRFAFA